MAPVTFVLVAMGDGRDPGQQHLSVRPVCQDESWVMETTVEEQDGSGGQGGNGAALPMRPVFPSLAQYFLQTLSPDVVAEVPEHPSVGTTSARVHPPPGKTLQSHLKKKWIA